MNDIDIVTDSLRYFGSQTPSSRVSFLRRFTGVEKVGFRFFSAMTPHWRSHPQLFEVEI